MPEGQRGPGEGTDGEGRRPGPTRLRIVLPARFLRLYGALAALAGLSREAFASEIIETYLVEAYTTGRRVERPTPESPDALAAILEARAAALRGDADPDTGDPAGVLSPDRPAG